MDQALQELKTKLALLKGEPIEQEAEAPAETPLQADKEEREKQEIRNIFKAMRLSPEEIEADMDEIAAKENQIRRSCPNCYRRQPIENTVCDLCSYEPDRWLPSEERYPRQNKAGDIVDESGHVIATGKTIGGHLNAHSAQCWLRWASTNASVDELKYTVAQFSDPGDDWKVKHAATILKLRGEAVPTTFWGEDVSAPIDPRPIVESSTVPAPVDATEIDFDGLINRCDREMAELNRQ